jgi:methyltransferase
MSSTTWFVLLVLGVGVERLVELIVSQRHIAWAKARGGVELAGGHYPAMVLLHVGLLVGSVVEVVVLSRAFYPWLGCVMFVGVLLAQGLRWWCIGALGQQWNTRVVVVPGAGRVASGPYRLARHPNYVAVVAEGVCLPLVHTAWVTATVFTVCNAVLMRTRISAEDRALVMLDASPADR